MKINIEDAIYPKELRKIKNPPKSLYVKGNIKLLDTPCIAIIGTRECTQYGERMAKKFSRELSIQGITIISGMAKGIDSFAHIGSIETTGNTIAVLPSGLNNIYPEENIKLYKDIIKNNGLIVTEYEENEKENSKRFLERNRIVSGIAIGTLVIEGGYRSGTSVTARLTKQQGKKIFCVPSSLESKKGITPNKLIKEGAYLVTEIDDIIKEYKDLKLKRKQIKNKVEKDIYKEQYIEKQIINETIKQEYKTIYNILQKEKAMNINEIVKKSKLDIKEVNYKLMMLELEDKIVSLPGSNFKIK